MTTLVYSCHHFLIFSWLTWAMAAHRARYSTVSEEPKGSSSLRGPPCDIGNLSHQGFGDFQIIAGAAAPVWIDPGVTEHSREGGLPAETGVCARV